MVDITNLTKEQAEYVMSCLNQFQAECDKKELEETAQQLRAIVDESRFSKKDLLFAAFGPMKDLPRHPAKYRNPIDDSQTWVGRGRPPKWFENALAGHAPFARRYSRKEMLIMKTLGAVSNPDRKNLI